MAKRARKTTKAKRRKPHWSSILERAGACSDSIRFARKYHTFIAAWKACRKISWMVWWLHRVKSNATVRGLLSSHRRIECLSFPNCDIHRKGSPEYKAAYRWLLDARSAAGKITRLTPRRPDDWW